MNSLTKPLTSAVEDVSQLPSTDRKRRAGERADTQRRSDPDAIAPRDKIKDRNPDPGSSTAKKRTGSIHSDTAPQGDRVGAVSSGGQHRTDPLGDIDAIRGDVGPSKPTEKAHPRSRAAGDSKDAATDDRRVRTSDADATSHHRSDRSRIGTASEQVTNAVGTSVSRDRSSTEDTRRDQTGSTPRNDGQPNTAKTSPGRHDTGKHDTGKHNTAKHDTGKHNTAKHNTGKTGKDRPRTDDRSTGHGTSNTPAHVTAGAVLNDAVLTPAAELVSATGQSGPTTKLVDGATDVVTSAGQPSHLVPELVGTVSQVTPSQLRPLVDQVGDTTSQLTHPVTEIADSTVRAVEPVVPVQQVIADVTTSARNAPTRSVDATLPLITEPVAATVRHTGRVVEDVAAVPIPKDPVDDLAHGVDDLSDSVTDVSTGVAGGLHQVTDGLTPVTDTADDIGGAVGTIIDDTAARVTDPLPLRPHPATPQPTTGGDDSDEHAGAPRPDGDRTPPGHTHVHRPSAQVIVHDQSGRSAATQIDRVVSKKTSVGLSSPTLSRIHEASTRHTAPTAASPSGSHAPTPKDSSTTIVARHLVAAGSRTADLFVAHEQSRTAGAASHDVPTASRGHDLSVITIPGSQPGHSAAQDGGTTAASGTATGGTPVPSTAPSLVLTGSADPVLSGWTHDATPDHTADAGGFSPD